VCCSDAIRFVGEVGVQNARSNLPMDLDMKFESE